MSTTKNWYHIIKSLISRESSLEALVIYTNLRKQQLNHVQLIPLILKACTLTTHKYFGMCLHSEILKFGVETDVVIGTSLLGMYAKCGDIGNARKVFDEMPVRNVVTWNAMMGSYLGSGDVGEAMGLFYDAPERNVVTWNEMIRGVARSGDTRLGRRLFEDVPSVMRNVATWTVMVDGYACNGEMEFAREVFDAMPEKNCFVWSVMINGYFRRGEVELATGVFEACPERNLVIWNSLVSGFAKNGFCEDAIEAFGRMQVEGFEPDEVTVASVLSACSQLGALDVGREVHSVIHENGIKLNQFVINGLVDMYAKCGDLSAARSIFEGMSERNVACWNSMISGFAIHGKCEEAVDFFHAMADEGVNPDEVSFLSVLSACVHGGFVEKGLNLFSKMKKYGVMPGVKHYGCIIDLLGRAGRLKQAFDLIKNMPMKPNDTIWGSLLGACRIHSETTLTEEAMEDMNFLDSNNDSHYVLLSNVYSASNRWDKAEEIRTAMIDKGLEKIPGSSSFH
ncbi:hypothetical protein vseg_018795 [Gypsophila vaccaria]